MDDRLLVHILQAYADLLDDCSCFFLWQFFLLFYLLEAAIRKCFYNKVKVFLIMKVAEQGSQIRMVQIGLDFDFSQYVVFYFHLSYSFLRHLLDYADEAYVFLLGHEDLPECALS